MTAAIGFPMPKALVVEESTATPTYAKFIAAPFQSGFGHTLGNSLRRVLLSSLEGAAITAVRIDGVKHEFDTLDYVLEDITEIVLNLKCVRLNLHGDGPKTLELRKDKIGPVTAGDIVCDTTVEILNPDQLICTLDKPKLFRAEIDVVRGKGYLPAEKYEGERPIGTIPVDCLFSPVTRVNYQVGAARVGEETEMDSLEIAIWTDGRISPQNALESAARILSDHLQVFMGGSPVGVGETPDKNLTEEEKKSLKQLTQEIEVLDLSVRAMNCLNGADIKLIGELCTKTESKMLKCRNFGRKSLGEIKEKMEKLGLSLGMSFSDTLLKALANESKRVRGTENEEEK